MLRLLAPQPLEVALQPPGGATSQPEIARAVADAAAQRVREAGGPTDKASYSCECGYLFAAAVSTTVACPHCGTAQAW